jgi:hypothetical protein
MRTLVTLLLGMLLVACASAAPTVAPSVTGGSTSPGPTTSPTASASAVGFPPTEPSGSAEEPARVSDVFDWKSGEIFLLAGVADDARPTCRPADELPEGSLEGIRCFPDGVKAVGFYIILEPEWLDEAYHTRLARYGITPKSGGTCVDGVPGDIVDSVSGESKARIGCYVDEDGLANGRFTLPPGTAGAEQGVYVGVVGTDDDIAKLFKVLEGRSWPGDDGCRFCAAPWGLSFESGITPLEP